MMSQDFNFYREQGLVLGLEGSELREYIRSEQNIAQELLVSDRLAERKATQENELH